MQAERVTQNDIRELTELRILYLTEDLGEISETDAIAIRKALPLYLQSHLNKDLFVYVVHDHGLIAACAFLLVVEKPMSPRFLNGKTGMVLNVYTRPAFRRRGYGRAVMEKMLEDAVEMQLCSIELKATEDGYPLYKAVGFADDIPEYHLMKWKNPEQQK